MYIVILNKAEVYWSEDFVEATLAFRQIAWQGNIFDYDPIKHDFNGLRLCMGNHVFLQQNVAWCGKFHRKWGATFIAPETGKYIYGTVGEVEFKFVSNPCPVGFLY